MSTDKKNQIEEEKPKADENQKEILQKIFDEDDDDFEEFEQEGSHLSFYDRVAERAVR
jgi:hypothetical protein